MPTVFMELKTSDGSIKSFEVGNNFFPANIIGFDTFIHMELQLILLFISFSHMYYVLTFY